MKKAPALLLLFFISHFVYAQPMGTFGAAPAGPSGPSGISGPSGPSGRGHFSGPPSSPPSHPSGNTPPGSKPGVPPSPPPSSGSSGSSSSSQCYVINYRGSRKASSSAPLEILETSICTLKYNKLNLVIRFNQAVNPMNINTDSFILNGQKLDSSVKIKFNRNSDCVTLIMEPSFISEEELKNSSIVMKNVQSFDGKEIEELIVK